MLLQKWWICNNSMFLFLIVKIVRLIIKQVTHTFCKLARLNKRFGMVPTRYKLSICLPTIIRVNFIEVRKPYAQRTQEWNKCKRKTYNVVKFFRFRSHSGKLDWSKLLWLRSLQNRFWRINPFVKQETFILNKKGWLITLQNFHGQILCY